LTARAAMRLLSLIIVCLACDRSATEPVAGTIAEFEDRLETLRAQGRIPGMSAAIIEDGAVAWSKGFGVADVEGNRPAADTTSYHLASLTKPFAATLLLQLVESGALSLDAPVSEFGIPLSGNGVIRVRHLLSHTSGGVPGTAFAYDGNRFGELDSVIRRTTGKSFATVLQERIIAPLQLRHTAPNPLTSDFDVSGHTKAAFGQNLARGYRTTSAQPAFVQYPQYFGTAAGLTASVLDMAQFSIALDAGVFLKPATLSLASTPIVTSNGATSPYGLGWFVTDYRGERIVWHYGLWTAISSLIVKVPDRGMTFIILANSEGLSGAYPLGSGRLETSPWARAFLDAFVLGTATARE
jgi:CubicO group peptidase (beta-lactamase class C family)